jgi:hypothetical protein
MTAHDSCVGFGLLQLIDYQVEMLPYLGSFPNYNRLLVGLRRVAEHIKEDKRKRPEAVIIPPDIIIEPGREHLDDHTHDRLTDIVTYARDMDIPVIFALSSSRMSRVRLLLSSLMCPPCHCLSVHCYS